MADVTPATAEAWAARVAQSWFLDSSGNDRLLVHGLSVGWASQIEVYQLLRELASRELGVSPPQVDRSLWAQLKRRGWDRAIRWLGLRLMQSRSPREAPRGQGLLVIEIPTPSMADALIKVAVELGNDAVAASGDPRAIGLWGRAGFRPVGLSADPLSLVGGLRQALREFDAQWAVFERDPPEMRLCGRDLAPRVLPVLRQLLRWRSAWLPAEAEAFRRCLAAVRPRTLLLASDQHRLGWLATTIARQAEVPTLVLQHGLPQERIGYVPVVADVVACWSEHSRDWLLAQGTERSRLIVTGSPVLDSPRPPAPLPAQRRVLWLPSPTVSGVNERLTRLVLEAARRCGWAVTLKLHPGHRGWATVVRVAKEHADAVDVRICHREPLVPLIDEASLVVVHRSTAALQALARRRPVVALSDPRAGSTAELDLPMLRLPVASSADELSESLVSHGMPQRADDYFEARREVLGYVLGPLDGRAAARVAALVRA